MDEGVVAVVQVLRVTTRSKVTWFSARSLAFSIRGVRGVLMRGSTTI